MLLFPIEALMPRALLSLATAFSLSLALGPWLIRWLKKEQMGQHVRELGPKSHYQKSGTPTMGGALVLGITLVCSLLWGELNNGYLWMVLVTLMGFGTIGWVDDYRKIVLKNNRGLAGRWKYTAQSVLAIMTIYALMQYTPDAFSSGLRIPFSESTLALSAISFAVLGYFVIVGASNAVNLTDGLDGLAVFPIICVVTGMAILAYIASCPELAHHFSVPFVEGAQELVIVCAALIGSGLGFLWFNSYPAAMFMGDVGALALGAALGVMALILRQELVLFLMSLVFVAETVSVILQVGSFKLRGKRIFKMAPIHHHFELLGLPETKVVVRFWIVSILSVLLGLSTLL